MSELLRQRSDELARARSIFRIEESKLAEAELRGDDQEALDSLREAVKVAGASLSEAIDLHIEALNNQ